MNAALLLFEISDKEPTLSFIWTFSLILAIAGFCLVRLHPLFLPLPLFFSFLFGWLHIDELNDPFVADAIISELGYGYVIQSYIAIAISIITPFLGIPFWFRRVYKKS